MVRRGILFAGLVLALTALSYPAAASAKKWATNLKEDGFNIVRCDLVPTHPGTTCDILKEVLRGHITLTRGSQRVRLRTTEYVAGVVTFTGSTSFDVDLDVRIDTKRGAFFAECTGSAVGSPFIGWDGVWHCTITGGTRLFKGATGRGTPRVHIVPISVDTLTKVSFNYISSVRAKGTISF